MTTDCAEEEIKRSHDRHTVVVYRRGFARSFASCSCGWTAPSRVLKALACQDAWAHAAETRGDVNYPLVMRPVFRSR
jgi:hypothetical protein